MNRLVLTYSCLTHEQATNLTKKRNDDGYKFIPQVADHLITIYKRTKSEKCLRSEVPSIQKSLPPCNDGLSCCVLLPQYTFVLFITPFLALPYCAFVRLRRYVVILAMLSIIGKGTEWKRQSLRRRELK